MFGSHGPAINSPHRKVRSRADENQVYSLCLDRAALSSRATAASHDYAGPGYRPGAQTQPHFASSADANPTESGGGNYCESAPESDALHGLGIPADLFARARNNR